jgi:putative membrane protein
VALAGMILTALIAAEHLWFAVLEMFLWTKPAGLRAFRQSPEQAQATRVMAVNQGIYNAFLAAGLAWGCLAPSALALPLKAFFLGCVVVAGLVGGFSAFKGILWIQAAPAALALALVLWG